MIGSPGAIIIPLSLWWIWKSRNGNLFNNTREQVPVETIIAHANEYYHLVKENIPKKPPNINIQVQWEPPPIYTFKLNVDGAAPNQPGQGGIGCVIRDHTRNWKKGLIKSLAYISPIHAKLLFIRYGLQLAIGRDLTPIHVCSDSSQAISMMLNNHICFNNLISECRYLMQVAGVTTIKHTYREGNRLAGPLAKEGTQRPFAKEATFLEVPPMFAIGLLEADIRGTTFVRKVNYCNSNGTGQNTSGTNDSLAETLQHLHL